MQLVDSKDLRDLLGRLLPGLVIEQTAKPSGQRIVYFCTFEGADAKAKQIGWGKIVLKVAAELHPTQIAYLQKEDFTSILVSTFFSLPHSASK